MSMPTFPEHGVDITQEQAFNMLLGSIAMEELGLSHILNAEGEKLQYILGTLPGAQGTCATTQELLQVNRSITDLLENVMHNQLILKGKLEQVLRAKERHCPHPPVPPCPPHPPCPPYPPCKTRGLVYGCERYTWRCGCRLPWRLVHGNANQLCAPGGASSLLPLSPQQTYQITCSFWVYSQTDEDIYFSLRGQSGCGQQLLVCSGSGGCTQNPLHLASCTTLLPQAKGTCAAPPLAFVLESPSQLEVLRATTTILPLMA